MKKLLALLAAAVMLLGLLPVTAAASEDVSSGTVPTDIINHTKEDTRMQHMTKKNLPDSA